VSDLTLEGEYHSRFNGSKINPLLSSVRIPSALCGLYGLRPSYGRVPYGGAMNTLEGQDSILSVLGPMANSVFGLKVFMEAVIKSKPWLKDPLTVRKKWDEDEYLLKDRDGGRKLCFAIMWDDGVCAPHPPITRALKRVQAALTQAGHNGTLWSTQLCRFFFSDIHPL
jgi:Asp-tRNA(Asn)/Glu-tRNA(Gln) amidotransferase A subunit family amidase